MALLVAAVGLGERLVPQLLRSYEGALSRERAGPAAELVKVSGMKGPWPLTSHLP